MCMSLCEQLRRKKLAEKMAALQEMIPNSVKVFSYYIFFSLLLIEILGGP